MTTISFWEKQYVAQADIVVIGNGIVGLQCAIHLKKKFPGRRVWVVDRAPLSRGASMRNAGFVCFGSVGEILDDIQRTDRQTALALYEKRYRGIQYLLGDFGTTMIGYEPTGGYEIFEKTAAEEQQRVLNAIDELNRDLATVSGPDTFRAEKSGKLGMNILDDAVFAKYEGAVQTHLLYKTIYQVAISSGVEIYSGLSVLSFQQENHRKWRIVTAEGYDIACRTLVLCTNAFTGDLLKEADVQPARGQVLVTGHIPTLQWRGIMHADKGYIYFRSLGTRILIGGARNTDFSAEATTSMDTTAEITGKLCSFLETVIIPGIDFTIEHQWAGIMGMAENRSPIVKEWSPGLFVCVRMGGMGLALSAAVSRELATLVQD